MVDTSEEIIVKFRQNLTGLFRRFRIMIKEAPREVVSEFLIDKIEEFVVSRNAEDQMTRLGMTQIYQNVVEKGCAQSLLDKDVQFFQNNYAIFLSGNTGAIPSGFLGIIDDIFTAKNEDGTLLYSPENMSKLFDFAIALVKMSIKYVLSESQVVSVSRDESGNLQYVTSREIVPGGDAETLSRMVNLFQLKGVPLP